MTRRLVILFVFSSGLLAAPSAARQQVPESALPSESAAAPSESAPVPSPAGAAPYESALREECTAEMSRDAAWRAEVARDMRAEVHSEDAAQMLRNKKHVVAAYAVLWALVVLFVALLWTRQRRLAEEISRLERDLARAAGE